MGLNIMTSGSMKNQNHGLKISGTDEGEQKEHNKSNNTEKFIAINSYLKRYK